MTIPAGARLGPYEVLSPLGAGGMGEVYRAKDTRLHREVAIKVLPASFSEDADRLRRFEGEARAASALNHPNILTVHDFGSEGAAPYVVSELLEGETLREKVAGGRIPVRKALDYAAQIARGLAAAHEKGIVHRDLKPENLFVTKDGRVKILDFGLAKLTHPPTPGVPLTELPTEALGTEPGVVMGTVGYMSPEQVRGLTSDSRSDLFAFGGVLYEMLTGERAFRGETAVETMNAILKEDPPEPSRTVTDVPPSLDRILRHCLEKSPEERFQSARDVAFALESLSEFSSDAPIRRRKAYLARRFRAAAVGLLVLAAAVTSFVVARGTTKSRQPSFRQLTFRHGAIGLARFAPDGETVVYSAQWEKNPFEIFTTRPGTPESRSLLASASILSISSLGELAILLGGQSFSYGTLARVPLAGGAPREILERVHYADWAPDGRSLAVLRTVAGKVQLEYPVGKVLYEAAGGTWWPRVSPRGDRVAIGEGNEQLVLVDSSGKRTDLVRGRYLGGYAWSAPDEIWFIRVGEGNSEIRAVTTRSRQRLLASMPGEFILQDVSGGRVLLERDSESWETVGVTSSDPRERRLSWLDRSVVADLSADGRTILFSEIGPGAGVETAVYLRKTDGAPAVRLGDGQAVALSPDGKWALARLPSSQMILLPTGAGEAKPLPPHGIRFRYAGAFFPDGQRVLLVGNEPGRGVRLYVQDITGGKPRPITHEGVALGQWAISISSLKDADTPISPDGKYVAALNSDRICSLYSVEGGPDSPPRQIPGLLPREEAIRWSADGRSIFVRKPGLPEIVYRVDPRSGRKQIWKEFLPAEPIGSGAIVNIVPAPDGRSWVYTYNRYFSDLFLVEGLK